MENVVSDTTAVREEVVEALRLTRERKFDEAVDLLEKGLEDGTTSDEEQAVLYSMLGMILKKQGDMEKAWKAYQQAERSIPDDPVLKIIVGRFLADDLDRLDDAIKKGKEILKTAKDIPSFTHQAYCLMGLAYLKKGDKRKAGDMLDKAMRDHFKGIASADNVDFKLVEALLARSLEVEKCRQYIEDAHALAQERKEYRAMTVFKRLLDSLETTSV